MNVRIHINLLRIYSIHQLLVWKSFMSATLTGIIYIDVLSLVITDDSNCSNRNLLKARKNIVFLHFRPFPWVAMHFTVCILLTFKKYTFFQIKEIFCSIIKSGSSRIPWINKLEEQGFRVCNIKQKHAMKNE